MTSDTRSELSDGVRRMSVVQTGRRRRWSDEQKLRIVEEAMASGTSLLAVARRHEVDPGQIYMWRKILSGASARSRTEGFAAVVVSRELPSAQIVGRMEIVSRSGRRVVVGPDVDVAALARVIAMLEQ